MNTLREFYMYRELLKTNVRKDIRGRYKGTFLGMLWTFVNPLLQVFVYYLVFPYLMGRAGGPIPNFLVYLITGMFPWNFFLGAIVGCTGCIKGNAGVVKKVYFPRKILVMSQVLSNLVNFMFTVPIMMIFCLVFGIGWTWHLLWIPVIAVIEAVIIYGAGLILSAVNVYVQDVENIVQFLLNLGFYATPIVYPLSIFGGGLLSKIIQLNPMTMLVNAYRAVMMYDSNPGLLSMTGCLILGLILVMIGNWVFNKLERGFAEEL